MSYTDSNSHGRKKLQHQFSSECASREYGVKGRPVHRMKKWSSWPVISYPGLDQVTQNMKR